MNARYYIVIQITSFFFFCFLLILMLYYIHNRCFLCNNFTKNVELKNYTQMSFGRFKNMTTNLN